MPETNYINKELNKEKQLFHCGENKREKNRTQSKKKKPNSKKKKSVNNFKQLDRKI